MSSRIVKSEIVVVGAGPAGLAAACVVAEHGRQVTVLDDTPWLGGQIWRGQNTRPSDGQARTWLERFRLSGAAVLDRTSVIAAPGRGVLLAESADGPREIHWQQLILATGARELFLPFPGWTLPGVMGPGAMQAMAKHGWPVDGRRVTVVGSGPLLLAAAEGLKKLGAKVTSIFEQAPWRSVARFGLSLWSHPGKLLQGARIKRHLMGVPYRCGIWPLRAEGGEEVRRVMLTDGRRTWSEDCDLLACGFGLVPNVELPLLHGCETVRGFVRVDEWQATSVPEIYCAGEPTGIGGVDCALVEGVIAGLASVGRRSEARRLFSRRAAWHRFRQALARDFALRPELKSLATDDTLLCRCEDVPLGTLKRFGGWREAKLHARCGMGACQGRVCGAAAEIVLGWTAESVRPPVLPASVESLLTQSSIGTLIAR